MTEPEIDFLIDYLIPLKKAGHFRAFWENFGQSVNLAWSTAKWRSRACGRRPSPRSRAEGVPVRLRVPEGRHARLARRSLPSREGQGKQLDQAYEYINWWLAGWPASVRVARQGYSSFDPLRTRRNSGGRGMGLLVRRQACGRSDLADPFGTIIIKKGDVRTGGSYWNRYSEDRGVEFADGRERLPGEAVDEVPHRLSRWPLQEQSCELTPSASTGNVFVCG